MSQIIRLGSGVFPPGTFVETITGNTGGPVGPDGAGNINVIGAGNITVSGNPGTFTETITLVGTTNHAIQIGNAAGSLTSLPVAGNGQIPIGSAGADPVIANITAGAGIVVTNGAGTITLSTNGAVVVTTLHTDDGNNVTPTLGVINVAGAHGLNTTGTVGPNTATWAINNAITLGDLANLGAGVPALTIATGDITFSATNNVGNLNMVNTHSSGNAGVVEWGGNPWIHNFGTTNTFVGQAAGNFTLTVGNAIQNAGFGTRTLQALTTGFDNAACGFEALGSVDAGHGNTAMGSSALQRLTSGNNNATLGESAAENLLTGSTNILIGTNVASAYVGAESSNIIIGNAGVAAEDNVIRIGTQGNGAGQQDTCYIAGIANVVVANTEMVTIDTTTGQLGSQAVNPDVMWSVIVADQTAVVNEGYFCNKAGTLLLALPAVSAVGDIIEVSNINTALGIQFTQAANQQIFIGNTSTTLGAAGTLTSSAVGDSLKIVCRTANLVWQTVNMIGNWTPA